MVRDRVVGPESQGEEEEKFNWSLRPSRLDECIGQKALVEKLKISIQAARGRGEPLEHIIFHGPPGLGKTTLAHIIASEMNARIVTTSGPALERAGDLMGILTNLEKGDVLFIDEIHRLSSVVEEFLYPAMEDFRVDFVVDKGPYARTIPVTLQPFTLVGATTRAGLLSAPMRSRFGINHHLDFWSEEELQQVVERSSGLLGIDVEAEASKELARRSRGSPRIVNRLLRRVRDYAQVKAAGHATLDVTREALIMEGVDECGLDDLDRAFLKTIVEFYDGGPVGIEAIAATLNEETITLEDMVEPYLLKIGFVARTRNGRKTTVRAHAHLKLEPGASSPQTRLF